jgi:phospholipid/cholesterol/gamma-HCH transport system substrate-binding protein
MEPDERYTIIGATVLALVLAAALAYAWLSSTGSASDFRYYIVHFETQSLEGLQVGGDVNMRGVKVGRVERYKIGRENINRVDVTIRVARKTPVSENTKAVVARNFVTGLARINLVTPGKPGPELTEVPEGEDYPVIPEGTSEFDQITESATRLAIAGEDALANVNALLTTENRAAFSEMLVGMRDVAVGLKQRLGQIDVATRSLQVTAQALQGASERVTVAVERALGHVEPLSKQADLLMRETSAAAGEARGALVSGRAALDEVQVAVRDLAKAARTLDREVATLSKRVDGATDASVLELRATAQDLRRATEQMSIAVERLSDPRAAIVGPSSQQLGPGERTK